MITKADYGIDAPPVIRNFILGGLTAIFFGLFLQSKAQSLPASLPGIFFPIGAIFLTEGLLMILYAKFGKFRHRDRILGMIPWRGDEQVLDVGTGRGLLMIGAARHLKTGTAVGIDIWSSEDLSANRPESTLANAQAEHVRDRVEIRSEDAQAMSFPEGTFDVVVSNVCLHNIKSADGRAQACREIARVLKPGGVALISDFIKTGEYASAFKSAGLSVSGSRLYFWDVFPPLRIVKAVKPTAPEQAL